MSVDMSGRAVAQRLKILEELWELSVSLMKARPVGTSDVENSDAGLREEKSLRGEIEAKVP